MRQSPEEILQSRRESAEKFAARAASVKYLSDSDRKISIEATFENASRLPTEVRREIKDEGLQPRVEASQFHHSFVGRLAATLGIALGKS